jgi:SAM-dependent methyltransferase
VSELSLRSANDLYERGLDEVVSSTSPDTYHAVGDDGTRRRIPFERWLYRAVGAEQQLLRQAIGPVLDVGCGPGRHVIALSRRGIEAVGVDISPRAVEIARERGAKALEGSIFEVPGSGGWRTALLLDGNIGIGGDPERLLARVRELLAPGGRVLVEIEPPQVETRVLRLRLEGPDDISDWIPWAWVGADSIEPLAGRVGLALGQLWSAEGRWFARLEHATDAELRQ